nr:MFS transporter [Actinomycetota bacterium]
MRGLSPGARRVLVLASAILSYETIYFTVLVPLLPYYETELDLTKTAVGVLTATYAAGAFFGALPGGLLALRSGTRAAVLVGLTLLVLGSVVFGLADSYLVLTSARFVQGIGSSMAWIGALTWLVAVAPQARRGEVIGIALGAAAGGSLVG